MATNQTDIGSPPRVDTSSQVALSYGKLTIKKMSSTDERLGPHSVFSVHPCTHSRYQRDSDFFHYSLTVLLGWGLRVKAATGFVLVCICIPSLVIAQKLKRNLKGWQCLRNNTRGCPLTSMCAVHNIETHSYCHIYQHASLKAKQYIAV